MNASVLKWKMTVNQLRYLYEELNIVKTMADEMGPEFQSHYEDFCRRHGIDLNALNRDNAEQVHDKFSQNPGTKEEEERGFEDKDDSEMHETFSKLFRKLAMHLHPDKVMNLDLTQEEKDGMIIAFKESKVALEERRYFILIDYAEKYNVPLPTNYKQQTRWMLKEKELVRQKLETKLSSYNYMFAEAETDEAKDNLIKQFMKQLFNYNFEEES